MKILQVVHGFPPEDLAGTQKHVYRLSKELAKRHTVFVFYPVEDCTKKNYSIHKEKMENFETYKIVNNLSYTAKLCAKMRYKNTSIDEKFEELIDEIKPDIIHFHHLISLSAGLIHLSKRKGIPVVLTLRDFWFLCHRVQPLKPSNILSSHKQSLICNTDVGNSTECFDCYAFLLERELANKFRGFYPIIFNPFIHKFLKNLSAIYFGKDIFRKRNKYLKQILLDVDLITFPSEFLRNVFIEKGIPKEKTVFYPHTLDINEFKISKKDRKTDIIRFSYIGGLTYPKGVHILIEAFNKVKSKKIELKIYGEYEPDKVLYHKELQEMNKNINIKFMGEYSSISSAYNDTDVLIVPSICYESYVAVIQEAFLFGIPVIASKIGAIPEHIKDNENGMLFEPNNADDLYNKIEQIIKNPDLIENFRRNIHCVKSIDKEIDKIENIYYKLQSQKSKDKKKRILHIAPFNFSGVPIAFVKAERKLGYYSRLITLGKDPRNYEEDICLNLPLLNNLLIRMVKKIIQPYERREERNIVKIPKTLPPRWEPGKIEKILFDFRDKFWEVLLNNTLMKRFDFFGFDIYQLDGGIEFLRNGKFMKKVKELGKKVVCCYLGIDLRITGIIPEIDRLSDLNITLEFDHLKLYPGIHYIPYPFDANKFKFIRKEKKRNILKICHAPTVRKTKNTEAIIKCVKELEKEYPCKLVLIEGMSHKEAIRLKYDCDILIDQIGELEYGINSLEGMAMGIPVCVSITDEFDNFLGNHPFIRINEENMKEKLIELIKDEELRRRKGEEGRKWVQEYHDPLKVIEKIHNLLR